MPQNEVLTLTVEAASKLLGISRALGFTLCREGRFPVEVLRCGRRILVPKKRLLALLGEGEPPSLGGSGNGAH